MLCYVIINLFDLQKERHEVFSLQYCDIEYQNWALTFLIHLFQVLRDINHHISSADVHLALGYICRAISLFRNTYDLFDYVVSNSSKYKYDQLLFRDCR